MAAEKSYVSLGVFVIVAAMLAVATGAFFVQRLRSREVIKLVTYFTEDVSGLDISSQVRFRGVPVGRVTDVLVHPDGTTIEIDFELFQDRLATVGENLTRIRQLADLPIAPRLRSRVIRNLVTGDAYLMLDVPSNPPPLPELGFTPRLGYVPSMPSPLAAAQERLPEVLDSAEETLKTLTQIVSRVPASLDRSDRFFTSVERILSDSQLPKLSEELRTFSASTTAHMAEIAANMDHLVGTEGALIKFAEEARSALDHADLPGSAKTAREAADRSSLAAEDLRRSLPAIRETLALLRELTRHLDEQPESVIYGPRPAKKVK